FLHSYIEPDGARVRERWSTEDEKAVAVAFSIEEGGREIVLFRRNSDSVGTISAGQLSTDGRVATIGFSGNGRVARAMGSGLTRLTFGGRDYVKTAGIADVYVDYENSAAAQIVVKSAAPGAVEVALDRNPAAVFVAPPHAPREARVIPFSWRNGVLSVKAPEMAEWVLWVDPAVDPRQPLPELELAIRDSAGAQRVKLEMAVADNGDWIGFADLMPREAGRYA